MISGLEIGGLLTRMRKTMIVVLVTVTCVAVVIVAIADYDSAVECLGRLEKLAHAAIPAILAVALLYKVIRNVLMDEKKP